MLAILSTLDDSADSGEDEVVDKPETDMGAGPEEPWDEGGAEVEEEADATEAADGSGDGDDVSAAAELLRTGRTGTADAGNRSDSIVETTNTAHNKAPLSVTISGPLAAQLGH